MQGLSRCAGRGIAAALLAGAAMAMADGPTGAGGDSQPGSRAEGPVKVEVVRDGRRWQLRRGGEPFVIRGAGIEHGDIAAFAAAGGNAFRTWAVDTDRRSGQEVLDEAHRHGLVVMLGLPVAAERWGFDYDDPAQVAEQQARVRELVLRHKDHPALLAWIIGNELNMEYENPKVYDAVNGIAEMIHAIDPNHPVTTTIAGWNDDLIGVIKARAPAIDFLSIQMYGELAVLPKYLRRDLWDGPYMVTEWGAIGHWEMPATRWRAPVEMTSSAKADNYQKMHRAVIDRDDGQIIGNFVFLWGQKQERTPTWYGMFTPDGAATETVDVMTKVWTGDWPANRAPRVKTMRLARGGPMDSLILDAGETYKAVFKVKDPDRDPLEYRWSVKPESTATQAGGDFEADIDDLPGLVEGSGERVEVRMPERQGAYRLFAWAYDGKGKAAHANIPFFVRGKQ